MKFLLKLKAWWKKSALTSAAYLGIGIGAKVIDPLGLGYEALIAGVAIFVYVNANIIGKLIKTTVDKL